MRILIAVVSCKKYEARLAAQRATWIPQAIAAGYNVEVFDGAVFVPLRDGVLQLTDDYYSLLQRTKLICSWVVDFGYTSVLKVDDDCFINVPKLEPYRGEYGGIVIGANDCGSSVAPTQPAVKPGTYPHNYASGGAYWLSRDAAAIVRSSNTRDWAEDRFVGHALGQCGIKVKGLQGYHMWNGQEPQDWTVLTQVPLGTKLCRM